MRPSSVFCKGSLVVSSLLLLLGCGGGNSGTPATSPPPSVSAPSITLSETSGQPGDILRISGTFNAQSPTVINFTDAAGNTTVMNPELVSSTEVDVCVPFYLNKATVKVGPGTLTVSVVQGSGSNQTTLGPVTGFQIADLPQTGAAPGAVTAEFLKQLQRIVAISTQNWQTIQSASNGAVNVLSLVSNQQVTASQLTAAQNIVTQVMAGGSPVPVTTISGNTVNLDSTGLALLDRILVAYLVNAAPAGTSARRHATAARRTRSSADTSVDSVSGIDSWFQGLLTSDDYTQLLAQFKQLRAGLNVAVGVAGVAMIILARIIHEKWSGV
jgi:hypothetical protein